MTDIKTIPKDELEKDLADSHKDIADCEQALRVGVFDYGGGSVKNRLEVNKQIVDKIVAELERREKIAK